MNADDVSTIESASDSINAPKSKHRQTFLPPLLAVRQEGIQFIKTGTSQPLADATEHSVAQFRLCNYPMNVCWTNNGYVMARASLFRLNWFQFLGDVFTDVWHIIRYYRTLLHHHPIVCSHCSLNA